MSFTAALMIQRQETDLDQTGGDDIHWEHLKYRLKKIVARR
jgi:hypothetical protein